MFASFPPRKCLIGAVCFALLSSSGLSAATGTLPYLDASLPVERRIDDLMTRLTLEEKIGLVHGNGKFRSGGVERLGVPYLWTADGPQGVREEVGLNSWEPVGATDDFATAMPVGMALGSSWDVTLAEAYGRVVGEEARARNKNVILGPAINIMRTPLCGRNYDYFGEDPWLSGRLAVGYVHGMQGEQTVACVKHFAVNNQEKDRSSINVEVDERTLREIYLPAFEAAVKEGGALSIMGAYNQLRGEHCCHNDYLLNEILKKEWKFQGSVISDWGGTHDAKAAALHGLDLEMGTNKPYDEYYLAGPFREAIQHGDIPISVLDDKVRRNLRMLYFTGAFEGHRSGFINTKAHQAVALQVAEEGAVLLKNKDSLLPLDITKARTIAVIGDNAIRKFAAGGNAAGVKAFHEITALEGITARAGAETNIIFSQGYRQPKRQPRGQRDVAGVRTSEFKTVSDSEQEELTERAVRAAKAADLVIFVGGLSHQPRADDEGVDRVDLSLPAHQDDLIAKLIAANPRTVVVLISGAPVVMDAWLDKVPSVLQAWYGGSEAGHAIAALLFGDINPSGKLPCTFPRSLADSPAQHGGPRAYPGENGTVHYDEGIFVGYRWYDTKNIEPMFPFGFGLSYTTFRYDNLHITPGEEGHAKVECDVTNTGARPGEEVVQFYVKSESGPISRPEKELKGFAKLSLAAGETKKVRVDLLPRAFAYFSAEQHRWVAPAGTYRILAAASSRDIRLTGDFKLDHQVTMEP